MCSKTVLSSQRDSFIGKYTQVGDLQEIPHRVRDPCVQPEVMASAAFCCAGHRELWYARVSDPMCTFLQVSDLSFYFIFENAEASD